MLTKLHLKAETKSHDAAGISKVVHRHANLPPVGTVRRTHGLYPQAEPLYKRSLAIREKALGPDHLKVAATLNNLAELYTTQGRYAEAEPLYKRSLAIWEKALGPNHPNVALSLENIAALYRATNRTNRTAEANKLEKRVERIRAIKR